jgi:4'-phosphopantetheinyl transferase
VNQSKANKRQVEIWVLALTEPLEKALEVLDPASILNREERQRLERFRVESKKLEFLASRLLLKELLTRCLGAGGNTGQIATITDGFGRPFWQMEGRSLPCYYSLSHSGKMVCSSLGDSKLIGCDVERRKPRSYMEELVDKVLSEEEKSLYCSMQVDLQIPYFYRCWTLKESFAKAQGKGLQLPFETLSFCHLVSPGEQTTVDPVRLGLPKESPPYTFFCMELGDYTLSVSAEGDAVEFHFFQPQLEGSRWVGHQVIEPLSTLRT